jgi:hypothetical protein
VRRPERRLLVWAGVGFLGVALVIQALSVGQPRTNPAVQQDAPWPDARSRGIAVGACYDCHSNQTRWPAYSAIAPMRWLVVRDVRRGREALNFSDWAEYGNEADDAAETVADGSMPPLQYRLLHSGARLSDEDKQLLIAALDAMEDGDGGGGGDGGSGEAGEGRGRGRGRGGG